MKKKIGIIIAVVILVIILSICAIFLYFRSKASLLDLNDVESIDNLENVSNENGIEDILLTEKDISSSVITEEELANIEGATQEKTITPEVSEITIKKEYPKLVKVNGSVYACTNLESTKQISNLIDGKISTTVEENGVPANDNESNFGTGYSYQIQGVDDVDVLIDGKWYSFIRQK